MAAVICVAIQSVVWGAIMVLVLRLSYPGKEGIKKGYGGFMFLGVPIGVLLHLPDNGFDCLIPFLT